MPTLRIEISEDDFRQLQWIVKNHCQDLKNVNNPYQLAELIIKDFAEQARRAK